VGVQTELMTFAEFEKLADPAAGHYELHHGELVLMPPRKKTHVKVQRKLFRLLLPFLDHLGFFDTELPFRPAPEYESWQCDIGFISQQRWDRDENEYFLGAPDLVVEVLSRSNTMDEILDRQDVCFQHGCSIFWTVDTKRRTVMVTTADRRTVTCDESSELPLPANVAEGSIRVAEIFR
jgi:Uma2 family endonuclease